MGDEVRRFGYPTIWVFLLLIVVVALVLNYPGYLIERTSIVHRLGVPCLLLFGMLGSIQRLNLLRAIGWIAIIWFMPAIMYLTADLEHSTPELRGFPTLWRVSLTSLLFIALLVSYWMLRLKPRNNRE